MGGTDDVDDDAVLGEQEQQQQQRQQQEEEQPAAVPAIAMLPPTKKSATLRDFLGQMDEYAPIVCSLLDMKSIAPLPLPPNIPIFTRHPSPIVITIRVYQLPTS